MTDTERKQNPYSKKGQPLFIELLLPVQVIVREEYLRFFESTNNVIKCLILMPVFNCRVRNCNKKKVQKNDNYTMQLRDSKDVRLAIVVYGYR